jgi:hypothetical protein
MAQQKDTESVDISLLERKTGTAEELTPTDKARLAIAMRVLLALALIFIAASLCLIFGPESRLTQSQAIFDFVKTIVPPIATLVIGFYFRSENP